MMQVLLSSYLYGPKCSLENVRTREHGFRPRLCGWLKGHGFSSLGSAKIVAILQNFF
jgi:hypothetical protein